jgi:hypothetical protein
MRIATRRFITARTSGGPQDLSPGAGVPPTTLQAA